MASSHYSVSLSRLIGCLVRKFPNEEIRTSAFTVSHFSKVMEAPAVPASSPVDLLDLDDGASPPVAPISQSPSPSAPSGDMLLLDMVRSPEIAGLTKKGKKTAK